MSMELVNREQEKGGGSLRSLVSSNTEIMHKVGSKLGELGAVRREVDEFVKQVVVNNEVITLQLQTLVNNDVSEKKLLVDEFKKVVDAVVVAQKNTVSIFNMVKKEIAERERVEKKIDEELKQLKLVINQKVKRQRYLWSGVGVLLISLVCFLGYLCNELKNLTEKMEKMQVSIDSSMAEVKGMALIPNQTKIGQQKDVNDRRKDK
jgi:hypothetical protein